MLNYLWSGMMLVGILWGAVHGQMAEVTQGALAAAGEAVSLCITMLGVMALWTGILEIGGRAGLVDQLTRGLGPFLTFMFPGLDKDGAAAKNIAVNIIANVLGLGWAAAPAGIRAMKELKKLQEEQDRKANEAEGRASREMCTFLILNVSSLQLIPMNMIAYRSQYGSVNPGAIVGPAAAATIISTAVAVVFCKGMERCKRE